MLEENRSFVSINNNRKKIKSTMNKFVSISFALIVLFGIVSSIQACVYDSDCGTAARCINGMCQAMSDCVTSLDCLKYGIYYECSAGRCIPSKHKICRSDADCKKNFLHKHCVNYRCT